MLSNVLSRTMNTLCSRYFIGIFILCFSITTAIFVLFWYIAYHYLTPLLASILGFAGILAGTLSTVIIAITIWLLLPLLLPFICTLFAEYVADRIEDREYSIPKDASSLSIMNELIEDSKFVLWMIFLNILCLPLYLIPIVNLVVYYLLNSYLLGRDFFETVLARHTGAKVAKQVRKNNRIPVLSLGFVITIISTVPVLNLCAPLIAIALMVHYIQLNNLLKAPS